MEIYYPKIFKKNTDNDISIHDEFLLYNDLSELEYLNNYEHNEHNKHNESEEIEYLFDMSNNKSCEISNFMVESLLHSFINSHHVYEKLGDINAKTKYVAYLLRKNIILSNIEIRFEIKNINNIDDILEQIDDCRININIENISSFSFKFSTLKLFHSIFGKKIDIINSDNDRKNLTRKTKKYFIFDTKNVHVPQDTVFIDFPIPFEQLTCFYLSTEEMHFATVKLYLYSPMNQFVSLSIVSSEIIIPFGFDYINHTDNTDQINTNNPNSDKNNNIFYGFEHVANIINNKEICINDSFIMLQPQQHTKYIVVVMQNNNICIEKIIINDIDYNMNYVMCLANDKNVMYCFALDYDSDMHEYAQHNMHILDKMNTWKKKNGYAKITEQYKKKFNTINPPNDITVNITFGNFTGTIIADVYFFIDNFIRIYGGMVGTAYM